MALVPDQKFSTFQDGGNLQVNDIVVGLRGGLNTRFNYTGQLPPGVVVPISNGGTGATTAVQARINLGLGTMAVQNANNVAITGGTAALTSGSVASAPVAGTDITNKTYVDNLITARGTVSSGLINQLAWYAANGTTVSGLATANSAVLTTNGSGVPALTGSMTNGQLLIGSTGNRPVLANLSAGSGISINNTAGNITISSTGSGTGFTLVTGTSQAMVADGGYVTNNAGLVTLTLPTTAAFGTSITVVGFGAGGWKIAQNASQQIIIGGALTTSGVAGSVASTNRYDSLDLVCVVADTTWVAWGAVQSAGLTIV